MKVKIKGLVFVGFAAAILSANAMAESGDNTVTSKSYVDNKFQTQANIQDSFTDQNRTSTSLYPSMAAVNAALTATGNSIGDGQIDIQLNGTSKGTFTVNQAGPTTVNVNGVEVTSNKTNTLSDQSTDTQYPSAKAVYDAIAANAEATTYTAGDNVQISADNEISATDTTYTAGSNITIDAANNNAIAATTGAVADGATTLVTGGAVYDAIAAQATADATTYQAYSEIANQISDGNGGWKALDSVIDNTTASSAAAPTTVAVKTYVDANVEAATTALNGKQDKDTTNVYKVGQNGTWTAVNSAVADSGAHITTTNETDGSVIINVSDTTNVGSGITASSTSLTEGKAVYDYVQSQTNGNVIPSMPSDCSAAAPCVLTNSTEDGSLDWVPIQQAE